MFSEDDLLPLSALQHLLFCERRAALVHIERLWEENIFTAEGVHLHERVHGQSPVEARNQIRIARGLIVRSLRLGLSGKLDMVEFHQLASAPEKRPARPEGILSDGVSLTGAAGYWRPFPVEYKRGRLRREESYEVQLCAQALCLEEMLGVVVSSGAIYYREPRRRIEIAFEVSLRDETERAAKRLHILVNSGVTPSARYEKKCKSCSLIEQCLPKALSSRKIVQGYIARSIAEALKREGGV